MASELNQDCMYCSKNELLQAHMIEICQLEASTIYLHKDQTHEGRCIAAFNGHKEELFELDNPELIAFSRDVARTAQTLKALFHADKINYAVYGDEVTHLHYHIVPKFRGQAEWGKPFENSPLQKLILQDEAYIKLAAGIREKLQSEGGIADEHG